MRSSGRDILSAFRAFLETLKVASTRRINARQNISGRLRQGRFFDRALRTVKEYCETVEYIHRNPVQRGLVSEAGGLAVVERARVRAAGKCPAPWRVRLAD